MFRYQGRYLITGFFFLRALKENQTCIWISSGPTDTTLKSGCWSCLWSLLAELHQGAHSLLQCINTPPQRRIRSTLQRDTSPRRHNIRGGAASLGEQGGSLCFTHQQFVCLSCWLKHLWFTLLLVFCSSARSAVTLTSRLSDCLFGLHLSPPLCPSHCLCSYLTDLFSELPVDRRYLSVCVTASPGSDLTCSSAARLPRRTLLVLHEQTLRNCNNKCVCKIAHVCCSGTINSAVIRTC